LPYSSDLSLAVPHVLSSLQIERLDTKPPKAPWVNSLVINLLRRKSAKNFWDFCSSLAIWSEDSTCGTASDRSAKWGKKVQKMIKT